MRRRIPRRSARGAIPNVLLLLACAALLTGCVYTPNGAVNPTAIQRDGEVIVIAVCSAVDAVEVSIEQSNQRSDWSEVLTATGSVALTAGDTFTSSRGPAGLIVDDSSPLAFDDLRSIGVLIQPSSDESTASATIFSIPEGGVPSDEWLQWDGELSEQPCG